MAISFCPQKANEFANQNLFSESGFAEASVITAFARFSTSAGDAEARQAFIILLPSRSSNSCDCSRAFARLPVRMNSRTRFPFTHSEPASSWRNSIAHG